MRIVGGKLGGRRFDGPRGDKTRPTSERVREALGSALASRGLFEGARVLDLFAGTGALGFEALSRGAASLVSVESDARTARALVEASRKLGVEREVEVVALDAFSPKLLRALGARRFDLVFLDPPYAIAERVPALLDALASASVLDADTHIVFEHASAPSPSDPERFATVARYEYGATHVRLLCARDVGETQ